MGLGGINSNVREPDFWRVRLIFDDRSKLADSSLLIAASRHQLTFVTDIPSQ
jgi:hypothetical protein